MEDNSNKSCSFLGDFFIDDVKNLRKKVFSMVEDLIKSGTTNFFVGHFGLFQALATSVCSELKKKYPIQVSFVCTNQKVLKKMKKYAKALFGDLKVISYVNKQTKCNDEVAYNIEKMIDWSDIVVLCNKYDEPYSLKAYEYAIKQNKKIIEV